MSRLKLLDVKFGDNFTWKAMFGLSKKKDTIFKAIFLCWD